MSGLRTSIGFAKVLLPAVLGGGLWELVGLPLGWLMGAAVTTGTIALLGIEVVVPKLLYAISLAVLGSSVGLSIKPDVAQAIVNWVPAMVVVAVLGILAAVVSAPILARLGRMGPSTAYFSLLPGGVIEMAHIGKQHGADPTIVSAIHALRVALVVGLLPLALFAFANNSSNQFEEIQTLDAFYSIVVIGVGLIGGWIGVQLKLPAAWMLGAVILVGAVSATGAFAGRLPDFLLITVQVIVGMSLGSRFQRAKIASVPRALVAALPVILFIITVMALLAAAASLLTPFSAPTMILCFSIGGMAEMVLTSKILGQNVAVVAAFQAMRGALVNIFAGIVWRRLAPLSIFSDSPKG